MSDNISITTQQRANTIRIPDDVPGGPPYSLNQAGATYLITEDITAQRTAFVINASGITLDLGGHTLTYNEEHLGLPTDSINYQIQHSSFGVIAGGKVNLKILNGIIRQGTGNDESSWATIGFNPIFLTGVADSEIAGITVKYGGTQLTGIYCRYSGQNITVHHNVVEDLGRFVANRHDLVSAIKLNTPSGGKLYNNLVKRARHCALVDVGENSEVYNNELHIESYAINSFGIHLDTWNSVENNTAVHDNKIFGCGDNVVGISSLGVSNVEIYQNYIWLQAHDLTEIYPYLNPDPNESSDVEAS